MGLIETDYTYIIMLAFAFFTFLTFGLAVDNGNLIMYEPHY